MTTRKLTKENSVFKFSFVPSITTKEVGGYTLRAFSGVGYSGEAIEGHYFWGSVVFDLSTMEVPAKLPALVNHDRDKRAGYSDNSTIDQGGLHVSGVLLDNEHGTTVAKESDQGFPWQMSVDINPGIVEEVQAGTTVTVNGKQFPGPITVFKNSVISEVSFTPTGWDRNTSASAMSRGNDIAPQPSTGASTMTDEEKAKMKKLEEDNAALQASATKFAAEKRTSDIKLLFAATGREYKEDDGDVKELAALSDDAFNVTAGLLRKQFAQNKQTTTTTKPTLPADLTSHVATGGEDGQGDDKKFAAKPALVENARKRAEQFARGRSTLQ